MHRESEIARDCESAREPRCVCACARARVCDLVSLEGPSSVSCTKLSEQKYSISSCRPSSSISVRSVSPQSTRARARAS